MENRWLWSNLNHSINNDGDVSDLGQATTGFTITRKSDNNMHETADVLGYNKHSNQLSDCCWLPDNHTKAIIGFR